MKCPYCSFENPERSKFCGKCGKTLVRNIEDIKLERLTEEERIKFSFYNMGILIAFMVFLIALILPSLVQRTDWSGYILMLMLFGSIMAMAVLGEKVRTIKKKLK